MPITANEISTYLSGGAANSDPDLSIGGAKSSTEWTGGTLHDLFPVISGDNNAAQRTDFRCVYLQNDHGTLTWEGVVTWLSAQTAGGADLNIGLDPAGVNGTAASPADEETAPAGVTFSNPTTKAGGLSIGDMAAGAHQAIWFRRTATNSSALDNDGAELSAAGDTAE